MSTLKILLELDNNLAEKSSTIKTKLENGEEMLVFSPTIRGEVMALIVTWSTLVDNDGDKVAGAIGGQYVEDNHGTEDVTKLSIFIQLVFLHKRTVLIELAEAAVVLELWPLFELCCKTMANLISQVKTVPEAQIALGVTDDQNIKLSTQVIQGLLKYLPIEKRLELDAVKQNEWQLASNSVWSEVNVLFFGKGDYRVGPNQCKHNVFKTFELNSVKCTDLDLKENVESIKATRRRKTAEKFLDIIRKCVNLETIVWDQDFGQMASTQFARVLEQNCPHLNHIEGTVRREFEFDEYRRGSVVSPASFIDVFEPTKNISCFKVSYGEDSILGETYSSVCRKVSETNEEKFKANLRPILTKLLPEFGIEDCFAVDRQWFDKFIVYVATDSTDKPGAIDRNKVISRQEDGMDCVKNGIVFYRDYVLFPAEIGEELVAAFGLIPFSG